MAGKVLFPDEAGEVKYRGVTWGYIGDHESFEELGYPHHANNQFCAECGCEQTTRDNPDNPMAWNYFGRGCAWPGTRGAAVRWRNPLMDIIGFCQAMMLHDVLHNLDQGVTLHVIGNILFYYSYYKPGAPADNFQALAQRLQELYVEDGVSDRINMFKLSALASVTCPFAEYPLLHHAKAAETRHLAPVLLKLVEEKMAGGGATLEEQHQRLCLDMLCRIYSVICNGGVILSDAEARQLQDCVWVLNAEYSWLARNAFEHRRLMWSQVPKFHFLYHLGVQSRWLNPLMSWTYSAESFVGKISRIGLACSRGTASTKVGSSVLEKWLVAYFMLLTRLNV